MARPTVYVLSGEYVITETTPSIPLYHISQSISSLTHKISSIQFSRITINGKDLEDSSSSILTTSMEDPPLPLTKLYNLVHPYNAHYRTDIAAAYYMTNNSPSPSTLGNVKLNPSSSHTSKKKYLPFHKPTFTALLNPSSNSSSNPLFPEPESKSVTNLQPIFTAKPSRGGRVWEWLNASGEVIAREEGPDKKQQLPPRLIITALQEMTEEVRDALVALWVLRLWWAVAEEKKFDKEALLDYTTPDSMVYGGSNKMIRRTGALGAFVAAGGAC